MSRRTSWLFPEPMKATGVNARQMPASFGAYWGAIFSEGSILDANWAISQERNIEHICTYCAHMRTSIAIVPNRGHVCLVTEWCLRSSDGSAGEDGIDYAGMAAASGKRCEGGSG